MQSVRVWQHTHRKVSVYNLHVLGTLATAIWVDQGISWTYYWRTSPEPQISTFHFKTKLLLGGDLLETFCAKCLKCVWGDLSLQVQKYKVQKILHTKLGKHSDETDRLNKRWDMKKKITKRNFQRNMIWKGKTCESAEKCNFSF